MRARETKRDDRSACVGGADGGRTTDTLKRLKPVTKHGAVGSRRVEKCYSMRAGVVRSWPLCFEHGEVRGCLVCGATMWLRDIAGAGALQARWLVYLGLSEERACVDPAKWRPSPTSHNDAALTHASRHEVGSVGIFVRNITCHCQRFAPYDPPAHDQGDVDRYRPTARRNRQA